MDSSSSPVPDGRDVTEVPGHAAGPASVTALVRNIIDYAGLFPPAGLDMPTTVANYARYVNGPHAWMLERLVVPAGRLPAFDEAAATLLPREADADAWPITALTSVETIEEDVQRIEAFNRRHLDPDAGLVHVDVLELRADSTAAIDRALDAVPDELFPFVEIPVADDPRGLLAALVGGEAGAKIRTGGVTPELYPSPPDVARFIAACAAADVPFKATAGMHHPLRHRSDAVGAMEFGFLNVFLAAAFALYLELDGTALEAVLTEEDANAFAFDHDGVRWRDLELDTAQLEDSRLSFAVSFGSCSFDEPREYLEGLGLLCTEGTEGLRE